MDGNKGIFNYGNLKAENIATGDNASITNTYNNNPDLQQLSTLLDNLLEKIGSSTEPIPGKEDIVSSVAVLKEEIKKEKPGHITLKSIGGAILENLKYVKDLAPIAATVWQHIQAFIGPY